MAKNRISCHKCKYYYVTWEKNHAHGCRALGFKSKNIPSLVVFQNSGEDCKYFSPKNNNKKPKGRRTIIA